MIGIDYTSLGGVVGIYKFVKDLGTVVNLPH